MSKLIVIGGGYNGGDFDKELETTIRGFIQNDKPKVIFIPYASRDFIDNYRSFREIYEGLGCVVDLLEPGKESTLPHADLIYIGRGWTIPLIKTLKDTNAIHFLNQALENGAIVAGFSAGAHSLFSQAGSNEEEIGYTIVEGLGFVQGCIMSHYNYQDRAESFHQLLKKHKIEIGIGLEDHTMLIIEDETARLYSSKEDSKVYEIKQSDSVINIQPLSNHFSINKGKNESL
ncbi:Type 1 glutamine amidotransferase-like domain-containing protein [Neobacillus sp. D3-1R]|uniref:Type 1 glutamine amidotransferase-like domain-containing protein n=1 Tax=Neobacillus sp. D3-1R TaxID=3445778 RepID=UPI003FA17E41